MATAANTTSKVTTLKYWATTATKTAFGVSDEAIRRWREQKGLPYCVVHGNHAVLILFKPDELEQWADANDVHFSREEGEAVYNKTRTLWESTRA